MRLISLMLCSIFILFGCGADETPTPIAQQMPNYFPDTVGSRWVYRNADGSEWSREITDGNSIHGEGSQVFTYTPPAPETEFDYLKPDVLRVTESQVLFVIGEKIDRYVQNEIPASVADEFVGLELDIIVAPITHPEFVFYQLPLTANFQWDAFNTHVNGSIVLQNLVLLQFPFEVKVRVKGEVVAVDSLETPAGNFEETYQIEYQTEITQLLFSEAETTQQHQTVWFVPHVGIVKIENEGGITELIAYTFPETIEK
ncbi:hypothetical protein C6503_16685 [Candidatus Poribacteria bacterium]|nr:MAG: hypothetical protein C6503_16685 [Candidatus Poribacteria bacterium]